MMGGGEDAWDGGTDLLDCCRICVFYGWLLIPFFVCSIKLYIPTS